MFKTLLEKELKAILLSPKFAATFSVCSVLMLLSVFVGIREYQAAVAQYHAASALTQQDMQEQNSYVELNNQIYREPNPLQIFVAGVNNDIGRFSDINAFTPLKLTNSVYSDDPIFAVFRFLDFAFIVQAVLSLFAILFTYDALNGEREQGTLKLIFANAVQRPVFVLAKFTGAWLGLVAPLTLPVLISLVLLNLFGITLDGEQWLKLLALFGNAVLFFTFFLAFGILVSALTRQSSVSFMVLLVTWVLFVLIVPRAAVMAAGQMITVPSIAEIESQQDAFARDEWRRYEKILAQRWRGRTAEMEGMSKDESEAYRDEHMWQWMEDDEATRRETETRIDDLQTRLQEEARNRKAGQQRLAFVLSRFSPASVFQLAAMTLAGDNIDLKTRYEDAMSTYRSEFVDYARRKQKESGGVGGINVSVDSRSGFKITTGRDKGRLELSDMPRFVAPKLALDKILPSVLLDFGLLALYTALAFSVAFVRFLRYDVR